MNVKEALIAIMSDQGKTKAELARLKGVTPQSINSVFNSQKTMSVNLLEELAGYLDYRVALVPRSKKLPDGSVEVSDRPAK
ncbi:helix-turn-helix transcriptional regulator [Adlercreutzia sp. R25]|uniref:helix-turn-helix domain-containing protein n=1 Tax=Adlercreutzia shanghongiae TaxID=3111773 RepID=UPI002DB7961F|nr:helix-turn-helix transcriptional regulator [Adlercreutzia sp. R25]MEC4272948.1 helix-turn-helix transcriptional regulator [Adlercreutzia sp. R25]